MEADARRLLALVDCQTALAAAGMDTAGLITSAAAYLRDLTGAGASVVELRDGDGRVTHAAADGADPDVLDDATRAVMTVPLEAADRRAGVATLLSASGGAFSDADRDVATRLAVFVTHRLGGLHEIEDVERTSRRDPLTGLGNRRALDEALEGELARHDRYARTLSVCVVDLDGFGRVNETFGHATGDRVLVRVAEHLRALRGADSAFRMGGDEFAVLLPETCREEAELVARRLARSIREEALPGGVQASWGVAQADGVDATALLTDADDRLYARRRGRWASRAGRTRDAG
jgi:diguanylate cyclase (GGDEF)-like protein